ncbi:type II toxin-antitoxin system PemK/MazF family toxin [Williamsoniiplasma luminosum]|uniref:Uncharacterized protein n=1 Tax=Williamsoniiplasma luminosum TaxID=214888 RepID=A0A2S0NJW6_9MOLU|nr:type II toxin-antitoxin system PemK/MazF family toxin [Williamsoniiplasma luminosum]AVP49306.1 MAG: hypothetical protein C5T88_01785 [Williamsoniiplasma luminosum]
MNENIKNNIFKEFDIVLYSNVHQNYIFEHLEDKKIELILEPTKEQYGFYRSKYIKSRPAIILKKISETRYLILPLTSSKDRDEKFQETFRTAFSFTQTNFKESYIQWDKVTVVSKKELQKLFRRKIRNNLTGKVEYKNYKTISDSTKRWIWKTYSQKIIEFEMFNFIELES